VIVVAVKEVSILGGKSKLRFLYKVPVSRTEFTDSKHAYPRESMSERALHPIRTVVDQTGHNPETLFHLLVTPPGTPSTPSHQRDNMKSSTKDLEQYDDSPIALSLVVSCASNEQRKKWMDKIHETKNEMLDKEKGRAAAIEKVHGKKNAV